MKIDGHEEGHTGREKKREMGTLSLAMDICTRDETRPPFFELNRPAHSIEMTPETPLSVPLHRANVRGCSSARSSTKSHSIILRTEFATV